MGTTIMEVPRCHHHPLLLLIPLACIAKGTGKMVGPVMQVIIPGTDIVMDPGRMGAITRPILTLRTPPVIKTIITVGVEVGVVGEPHPQPTIPEMIVHRMRISN